MNIPKTLKYIRENMKIPQNDVLKLDSNSHSTYSRIENEKVKLSLDTLQAINTRLGITNHELFLLSSLDQPLLDFKRDARYCIANPDKQYEKEVFLKKYFIKKHVKQMTKYEFVKDIIIKVSFCDLWRNEVPQLTEEELLNSYIMLVDTEFHSELDYMLAMNLITRFDRDQVATLVKLLIPLKQRDHRTEDTKVYADLLITNIIAIAMYEMDYERALEYVNLASRFTTRESYYQQFNILYHKYMILRFQKNDTKYIEKARALINVMNEIGDKKTAKYYLDELDKLNDKPDLYKGNTNYSMVPFPY